MRKLLFVPALLALAIGVQAGGKKWTKVTLTMGTGEEVGWVKAKAKEGGNTKLKAKVDLNVLEYLDAKVEIVFRVRSKDGGAYEETVEADVNQNGIARAKAKLTTPATELDYVTGEVRVRFDGRFRWIPTPAKFEIPLKKKK